MAFIVGFGLAVLLSPAAGALGRAVGLVDRPSDALKIHARPVPVLGGLAAVVATFGALAATGVVPLVLLGATVVLLGMGLADDAWDIPQWVRLLGQAAAGVILVAGGFRLEPLGLVGIPAAILVVMVSTNAVNMMDGQDGLVGSLGIIAALALAVLAAWSGAGAATALALSLAGALSGFLVWNRPPARIFLGNGGAYAVGAMLAVIGMMIALRDGWRGLLAAGTCLGIFAFELVYTVIRRALSGSAVIPGDRLHSYDVVALLAGTRTRSTFIFSVLGLAAAGLGLLVGRLPLPVGGPLLGAATLVTAIAGGGFLFRTTRALKRERERGSGR